MELEFAKGRDSGAGPQQVDSRPDAEALIALKQEVLQSEDRQHRCASGNRLFRQAQALLKRGSISPQEYQALIEFIDAAIAAAPSKIKKPRKPRCGAPATSPTRNNRPTPPSRNRS